MRHRTATVLFATGLTALAAAGCGGDGKDGDPLSKASGTPADTRQKTDTTCTPVNSGYAGKLALDAKVKPGGTLKIKTDDGRRALVEVTSVSEPQKIVKRAGTSPGTYLPDEAFVVIRYEFRNTGKGSANSSDVLRGALLRSGEDVVAAGHIVGPCKWLSISAAKEAGLALPATDVDKGETSESAAAYVLPAKPAGSLELVAPGSKTAIKLPAAS